MFAEQSSAILPDDAPLFLHGMNQLSSATAFIRIIITTSFIPLNSLMVATHQQTTRHHDTQNTFTIFSAVISHNTSATRRHCACIGFFRMASTQSTNLIICICIRTLCMPACAALRMPAPYIPLIMPRILVLINCRFLRPPLGPHLVLTSSGLFHFFQTQLFFLCWLGEFPFPRSTFAEY